MSASAVATRSRASTTFSSSPDPIRPTASADDGLPGGPAHRPVGEGHVARCGRRGCGSRSGTAASSSWPMTVIHERPRRVPTTTRGTTRTLSPGSSAKPKLPKLIRPVPGVLHLVADHGGAGDLLPPVGGVGEAVGAGGPAAGRHAPGDHALAAAQPGHRLVGGKQVEQARGERLGCDDLDGASHQAAGRHVGGGGTRAGHDQGAYVVTDATPQGGSAERFRTSR